MKKPERRSQYIYLEIMSKYLAACYRHIEELDKGGWKDEDAELLRLVVKNTHRIEAAAEELRNFAEQTLPKQEKNQ